MASLNFVLSILNLDGQEWLRDNAAAVLDAVVDAIITIDGNGVIHSHNKATETMFGYNAHELEGSDVALLMPEPHQSTHQGYVDRYARSGQAQIIGIGRELEAKRKDGTTFPIYLAVSEFTTPQGVAFVGIVRDLSSQKAAHDALLEQKDRSAQVGRLTTMGEMTASIAHEINQPLSAIAMYAQACIRLMHKDKGPDGASQTKILDALEKLSAQSLRAGDVIERIQRFVQNASPQRELTDLNQIVRETNLLAAGDARLHGIELVYDLANDVGPVNCDSVQIQQVLLNLVRNAIDAMFATECAQGRQIRVTSRRDGERVLVSVFDQGPGVDESEVKRLFTPFHSTKDSGMGMGLAICKTIVEDHGGELGLGQNSALGAEFYFTIPITDGTSMTQGLSG